MIEFLFITKMKLARDLNLYIFIVPTVIMLFLVLKDVNVTLRLNCLMLRKMSVVIYCSHVLIMRLMDAYVFSTVKVNSLVRCVGVLLVTYMISFLIVALSSGKFVIGFTRITPISTEPYREALFFTLL